MNVQYRKITIGFPASIQSKIKEYVRILNENSRDLTEMVVEQISPCSVTCYLTSGKVLTLVNLICSHIQGTVAFSGESNNTIVVKITTNDSLQQVAAERGSNLF